MANSLCIIFLLQVAYPTVCVLGLDVVSQLHSRWALYLQGKITVYYQIVYVVLTLNIVFAYFRKFCQINDFVD